MIFFFVQKEKPKNTMRLGCNFLYSYGNSLLKKNQPYYQSEKVKKIKKKMVKQTSYSGRIRITSEINELYSSKKN